MRLLLPSCGVVILTMLVNGPLPIFVIAATEKSYMVGIGISGINNCGIVLPISMNS